MRVIRENNERNPDFSAEQCGRPLPGHAELPAAPNQLEE